MSKDIEIAVNLPEEVDDDFPFGVGGIGASFPNDPLRGRFRLHGVVVGGLKSILKRRVEIIMTVKDAKQVRDDLDRFIKDYPQTGIEAGQHTGGGRYGDN